MMENEQAVGVVFEGFEKYQRWLTTWLMKKKNAANKLKRGNTGKGRIK